MIPCYGTHGSNQQINKSIQDLDPCCRDIWLCKSVQNISRCKGRKTVCILYQIRIGRKRCSAADGMFSSSFWLWYIYGWQLQSPSPTYLHWSEQNLSSRIRLRKFNQWKKQLPRKRKVAIWTAHIKQIKSSVLLTVFG